jgi:hypothetical protein
MEQIIMSIEVKFQFIRTPGQSTRESTSRCIRLDTSEVIAEFPAGALCVDPLDDKKHYNSLLKPHGWKIVNVSNNQSFAKQIN